MTIRDELLEMRERIDRILRELPEHSSASVAAPRYLKIPQYADRKGLSARTIRDYCELGMPHEGKGHTRRVIVESADSWIAAGGPQLARMARKAS
jgi:hypothetical protein